MRKNAENRDAAMEHATPGQASPQWSAWPTPLHVATSFIQVEPWGGSGFWQHIALGSQ